MNSSFFLLTTSVVCTFKVAPRVVWYLLQAISKYSLSSTFSRVFKPNSCALLVFIFLLLICSSPLDLLHAYCWEQNIYAGLLISDTCNKPCHLVNCQSSRNGRRKNTTRWEVERPRDALSFISNNKSIYEFRCGLFF